MPCQVRRVDGWRQRSSASHGMFVISRSCSSVRLLTLFWVHLQSLHCHPWQRSATSTNSLSRTLNLSLIKKYFGVVSLGGRAATGSFRSPGWRINVCCAGAIEGSYARTGCTLWTTRCCLKFDANITSEYGECRSRNPPVFFWSARGIDSRLF